MVTAEVPSIHAAQPVKPGSRWRACDGQMPESGQRRREPEARQHIQMNGVGCLKPSQEVRLVMVSLRLPALFCFCLVLLHAYGSPHE